MRTRRFRGSFEVDFHRTSNTGSSGNLAVGTAELMVYINGYAREDPIV